MMAFLYVIKIKNTPNDVFGDPKYISSFSSKAYDSLSNLKLTTVGVPCLIWATTLSNSFFDESAV